MGAETFVQIERGPDAQTAFKSAVITAQYDYGHAGYTGTIAEKDSFTDLTRKVDPDTLATLQLRPGSFDYSDEDPLWQTVDDKWGPAGCIHLGEGRYLFFGWASS